MTNYTPAQLEAWAELGPWEWCENWLYVANYNEHPGPVLWYTANDDGVHAKPDDAALIAAAPDLARLVLEKDKEIARLKAANYAAFTDGMEAAAQICGTLAEVEYDDADGFEAATGCEAAIMQVVKEQRSEQANDRQAMKDTSDE